MWCADSFLFVCFIAMIVCDVDRNIFFNLKADTIKSIVKSKRIDGNDNISNVLINENKYIIYVYDPEVEENSNANYDNKNVNRFYTCMNCQFAIWTQEELMKFIKPFPLLYNASFLDTYNNVFERTFEESVKILINITEYIVRFIDILLNFINASTYPLLIDTIVLKSLVSLYFKCDYIKTIHNHKHYFVVENENVFNNKLSDNVIIQTVFETINELQQFVVMNCELSTTHVHHKQFYGFVLSDNFLFNESKHNDIKTFLLSIKPINLESPILKNCTIKQMLLENIVMTSCVDKISCEIYNAEWNTNYGLVSVKDVFERIQHSLFNLDVIFWYQELILKTIMKIICRKLLNFFDTNSHVYAKSVETFRNAFKTIYLEVLSKFSGLPINLIDLFALLASKQEYELYRNNVYTKVNNYLDSLKEINLKTATNTNAQKYNKHDRDLNLILNGIGVFDDEESKFTIDYGNVDEQSLKDSSLDDFMNNMIKYSHDFKCFFHIYSLVYKEKNKYYMPFINNPKKINSFVRNIILNHANLMNNKRNKEDKQFIEKYGQFILRTWNIKQLDEKLNTSDRQFKHLVNDECKFVRGLYHYCFETIIYLNNGSTEFLDSKDKYYSEARQSLIIIKNYLIDVNYTITEYWNHPIFKIAYHLVPVMETVVELFFKDNKLPDLIRLLYMIMTELNKYGVEFCNPPEYNFGLFNNLNFDQSMKQISEEIEISLNNIKSIYTKQNGKHEFFNLNSLYDMFVKNQIDFIVYSDIIEFYWKGDKKNIEFIYRNIRSITLYPIYLYEFYDITYKHFISALYYEIYDFYRYLCQQKNKSVFKNSSSTKDCNKFKGIISKNILEENIFPKYFNNLITDFIEYLSFIYKHFCTTEKNQLKEIEKIKEKIDNQLLQFGIFVNLDNQKLNKSQLNGKKSKYKLFKKIIQFLDPEDFGKKIHEILALVSSINEIFKYINIFF